jgi:hypothetical protein
MISPGQDARATQGNIHHPWRGHPGHDFTRAGCPCPAWFFPPKTGTRVEDLVVLANQGKIHNRRTGMTKPIVQSVTFKASPEELFEIFTDSKKHSAATGGKASVSAKVGAKFTAWDGMLYIRA